MMSLLVPAGHNQHCHEIVLGSCHYNPCSEGVVYALFSQDQKIDSFAYIERDLRTAKLQNI